MQVQPIRDNKICRLMQKSTIRCSTFCRQATIHAWWQQNVPQTLAHIVAGDKMCRNKPPSLPLPNEPLTSFTRSLEVIISCLFAKLGTSLLTYWPMFKAIVFHSHAPSQSCRVNTTLWWLSYPGTNGLDLVLGILFWSKTYGNYCLLYGHFDQWSKPLCVI